MQERASGRESILYRQVVWIGERLEAISGNNDLKRMSNLSLGYDDCL